MSKKKQSQQNISNEAGIESTTGDLEQLRDILYGNQARETERRIENLEKQLGELRREAGKMLAEEITSLGNSAAANLAAVRQEIQDQLSRQSKTQAAQHQSGHTELTQQLNKTASDLQTKIQKNQQMMVDRLEKMHQEIMNQIQAIQKESRERDDDLRQELLTLGSYLDNKKTSRLDLGQMLEKLGQQLQEQSEPTEAG